MKPVELLKQFYHELVIFLCSAFDILNAVEFLIVL